MPSRPPVHRPPGALPAAEIEARRKAWFDRNRLSAYRRGYGRAWQAASKDFLNAHPLCAECARHHVVTAATVVNHTVRHNGDMKLFWDSSKWEQLCKPCHDAFTAREVGFAGGEGRSKVQAPAVKTAGANASIARAKLEKVFRT